MATIFALFVVGRPHVNSRLIPRLLKFSLLAWAPDCPRPRCCCCCCCCCWCCPAAVGTPYERRHFHSWKMFENRSSSNDRKFL